MSIDDLLKQKQVSIKQRWLDLVIETYPPDSRDFFKKQKNRFSNPVGAALARQIDDLYDSLLGDPEGNEVAAKLDDFVKIRTVQDFRPSEAVGFILFLKQAETNQLQKLSTGESLKRLLSVCSIPWHLPSFADKALALATRLVADIPMYELACTPDHHPVEAIEELAASF